MLLVPSAPDWFLNHLCLYGLCFFSRNKCPFIFLSAGSGTMADFGTESNLIEWMPILGTCEIVGTPKHETPHFLFPPNPLYLSPSPGKVHFLIQFVLLSPFSLERGVHFVNQSASFKCLCAYRRRSSWCLVCRLYLNKGRIVRSASFFVNRLSPLRSSGSDKLIRSHLIRSHTICIDKWIDLCESAILTFTKGVNNFTGLLLFFFQSRLDGCSVPWVQDRKEFHFLWDYHVFLGWTNPTGDFLQVFLHF